MNRILKRLFVTDSLGKVHHQSIEELADDQDGTITETTAEIHTACETCSHPVEKTEHLTVCQVWGRRCCHRCLDAARSFCAVCGKTLCPACRRGFAPLKAICCTECLPALAERQDYEDRLVEDKIIFERRLAACREQVRLAEYGFFHVNPGGGLLEDLGEILLNRKLKRIEKATRGRTRLG